MAQAKTRSSSSKKSSSQSPNGKSTASGARKGTTRKPAAKNDDLGDKLKAPLAKAKGPVLTGAATAAGLVGGAVIGLKYAGRRKRVLGVPIPGTGNGMARQVGKAGKQFGKLATEVRTTREKAEQLGKAIS